MKRFRLISIAWLMTLPLMAFSQEYKHFRVGIGTGIAVLSKSTGAVFYAEPSWGMRNFAVGLRAAMVVKGDAHANDFNRIGSWSVNGHYYFLQGPVRVFGGVGAGLYSAGQTSHYACDCSETPSKNVFGFYPRAGFEYKHLVVGAEYHIVARTKVTTSSIFVSPMGPGASSEVSYIKTNYFSLKFGVLLGGGKR